jgi:hypothetical protein
MMAEDWFSSPGFEWHPHRGIETVTTVLDGVLEHGDNLGNAGALGARRHAVDDGRAAGSSTASWRTATSTPTRCSSG